MTGVISVLRAYLSLVEVAMMLRLSLTQERQHGQTPWLYRWWQGELACFALL
ncbi:hypothetical protein PC116_g23761 [Phytophthora cactorum]|uniref:Uncharacterized protein n=1 Tax=Phytophthora cactorum TaxID=29920 RepID=A0A8T1JV45_9STRA|nr:hypothetical protein Pcac1_g23129 [Phytophthora cactorum]KAG2887270.1 hypothetical protein PC117_g25209 [Phytophthora cactorum]KAG3046051.1 hypothetical protein PC121_g20921 [Phytophthora cactorum]KAG3051584.1 hypothetical protein PC122_g22894 [Phytophthora cactorum]KAG3126191.1 hypothetical protein C6341_g25474 [Phytophthora cactorum]